MKVKTPKCQVCGQSSEMEVDEAAYTLWRQGLLIQSAFPWLSMEEREVLITGTHPECWKKMFPPEE